MKQNRYLDFELTRFLTIHPINKIHSATENRKNRIIWCLNYNKRRQIIGAKSIARLSHENFHDSSTLDADAVPMTVINGWTVVAVVSGSSVQEGCFRFKVNARRAVILRGRAVVATAAEATVI